MSGIGLPEHSLQKVPVAGVQTVLDNLLSSSSNPPSRQTVRKPPTFPKILEQVAFFSPIPFPESKTENPDLCASYVKYS